MQRFPNSGAQMSEPISQKSPKVDVFIAGAGPVGLFLANECARYGLSYRIVEANATQSTHSKALAIFPRTFEIFDMAGLAEPFSAAANRVTFIAFTSRDRTVGRIEFAPTGTPYPFVAMVPQDVTERLLLEHLRSTGGDVEYETTLVSARETDSGVVATMESAGSSRTVDAKYLVGCDGAHSTVRHLLDLPFEGGDYSEQFMLADAMTNDALPADEMQLCPSRDGPLAIFPMSASRRRIVATVGEIEGEAPSLDLVNELLRKRAPEGLRAESLVWSTYFRIHHRCVSQMSTGRMFVAGDAAHIHSPFGGQGMNTGLADAWNLGWKLNFAARGKAGDLLLPSYTRERSPIVKGVIEATHFLTTVLGASNPLTEGLRDVFVPVVTHLPQVQHAFVERLSGLGNSYKGSPIVDGSGRRYFDDSLRGGRGIGRRFILMTPAANGAAQAASNELAERFSDVLEMRTYDGHALLLLRPDGYVAYEAGANIAAAVSTVERVLRRQIVPEV
jgi:2-polyprenyl-6-methoxyphenol hydroxylase-like FAD-dependent oxidoreductase